MHEASKLMERADAGATTTSSTSRDGMTTYRREFRSSSGNGATHASTYYREVVVRGGPTRMTAYQPTQVPLPILVLLAALAGAWFAATRRFWANYQCTLYVVQFVVRFLSASVAPFCVCTSTDNPFHAYFTCRYSTQRRVLFSITWPLLVLASTDFRRQFRAALRGERVQRQEPSE